MQLSSSSPDGMPLRKHDSAATVPDPADDDGEIAVRPETGNEQPSDPFFIGATLQKRYRIDSLLFSDENSLIYRARDLRWDLAGICTDVGIKVFRPELRMQPQWVARLKREFYQTRLIKHP